MALEISVLSKLANASKTQESYLREVTAQQHFRVVSNSFTLLRNLRASSGPSSSPGEGEEGGLAFSLPRSPLLARVHSTTGVIFHPTPKDLHVLHAVARDVCVLFILDRWSVMSLISQVVIHVDGNIRIFVNFVIFFVGTNMDRLEYIYKKKYFKKNVSLKVFSRV